MNRYASITTLFIDLDDTIYPASSGVWGLIRQRIDRYMVERLQYPQEQVSLIRQNLFQTYGTTMRGLQATRAIDEADFLAYVHDVPVQDLLHPDDALREMLLSYPQKKIILTNADTQHALRVLRAVGLDNIFEQIVDIRAIAPFCKPQSGAFSTALRLVGETEVHHCVLIDDSPKNLLAATSLGFNPILVQESPVAQNPYPTITRLKDLPEILSPD